MVWLIQGLRVQWHGNGVSWDLDADIQGHRFRDDNHRGWSKMAVEDDRQDVGQMQGLKHEVHPESECPAR